MRISDVKLNHEYEGRTTWGSKFNKWRGLAIVTVTDKERGWRTADGSWTDQPIPNRARTWVRGTRRLQDGSSEPCIINYRSLTPLTPHFMHIVERQWEAQKRRNMAAAEREEREAIAYIILNTFKARHVCFDETLQQELERNMIKGDLITCAFVKHLYDNGASMIRFGGIS
jgi:hypothetical protein